MLSPILALFARINKPLWLNIRSTGAEVAGGQKTFSSNGYSTLYVSLCATSTQGSEFGVWGHILQILHHYWPEVHLLLTGYCRGLVSVSRLMSDEDRVSTVSSPKAETRGFKDQDHDSEVPRPRLRGSRPRPRLVKTGLETSRDQDSSLENSKSDYYVQKFHPPVTVCYILYFDSPGGATQAIYGTWNFAVTGAKIWNGLPADLQLHAVNRHSGRNWNSTCLSATSASEDFYFALLKLTHYYYYYITVIMSLMPSMQHGISVFWCNT